MGVPVRGWKGRLGNRPQGLWAHPARLRFQVATAALRRVPETLGARGRANGSRFRGARSRAWLGAAAAAPPPRAQAALQSWPRGSARPPSPRLRLRLRRARPRLALPPQLPLGAGRSGSPDAEPGKPRAAGSASKRPTRAAAAAARPRCWGGRGGGRCFSGPGGRRAPGVRVGAAPPEPGPPSGLSARLAESSGRGAAEGRAAKLQPRAGRSLRAWAPATRRDRRAQQPSPPPRSRRGHGRAGRRAGPRDPQSLLARWARSRGRARARRPQRDRESPDWTPGRWSQEGWLGLARCRLQS